MVDVVVLLVLVLVVVLVEVLLAEVLMALVEGVLALGGQGNFQQYSDDKTPPPKTSTKSLQTRISALYNNACVGHATVATYSHVSIEYISTRLCITAQKI